MPTPSAAFFFKRTGKSLSTWFILIFFSPRSRLAVDWTVNFRTEKQFVLLDSNSKKTRFITQVIAELLLDNAGVVHSRSEEYHPHRCFDIVITRAFSSLKEMLEKTEHLCCPEGRFFAMKGNYPVNELKDLSGAIKLEMTKKLLIPNLDAERQLVILKRDF